MDPDKKVLITIKVPNNNYCWDGRCPCDHFDNEGGPPYCKLDIGDLEYDEKNIVPKPSKCLELKGGE